MWWFLADALADDVKLVLYDPPHSRSAPMDRCDVELCSSLLQLVRNAKVSIDFAFYGMRSQSELFEAMRDARARGVKVRGVVDMDVKNVNYYDSTGVWQQEFPDIKTDFAVDTESLLHQRSMSNIQYKCPRPTGFEGPLQCLAINLGNDRCYLSAHVSREVITYQGDIMHDKFVVVDGRYVWTGSTNASDSCAGGYNSNLVMVVDSPQVAEYYHGEFEQMYAGKFHGTKTAQTLPMRAQIDSDTWLEVYFSPQHTPMKKVVEPLLVNARASIDIAVFFLTHKGVAQDLIDAHNRGVKVRVVIDSTGASNEYSKHEVLRLAGIPVKIEDFGGKMHAKSAVIDGEIVIGGSMNWTGAGEEDNDENTIVLHSREHGTQYEAWFEKLWARIPDKWLQGRPDAESQDSGTACRDGVDNDYDKATDLEDPGCRPNPPALPAAPPYQIVSSAGAKCSWDLLNPDQDQ
jgi:phosphatidylserine/phosphatidylglycerophosphate/cardiolipin synthase-like enzyme